MLEPPAVSVPHPIDIIADGDGLTLTLDLPPLGIAPVTFPLSSAPNTVSGLPTGELSEGGNH